MAVTIYLRYVLNTRKLKEFEHEPAPALFGDRKELEQAPGKLWIPLVEKFGGQHHGYFMPSEGDNNIALALFTFESLAAYEVYRQQSMQDAECQAASRYAEETGCIVSYERSFFRPVFA